jgi:hypothetical protein
VPFGKALIVVLPFVVLVWNAKRLLNVALLMSPVMRWAVLENVRLPDAANVVTLAVPPETLVAVTAVVAVAALPLIETPHVPVAPVPDVETGV